MGRLDRQHILVTGGSRGIGAAIVEKSLQEGAKASFVDIEAETGESFLKSLGAPNRVFFQRADIRSAEQIAAAHAAAVEKLGPVTGLVNNAGRNSYADPVAMTEAPWDDVFSVDLCVAMWSKRRGWFADLAQADCAARRASARSLTGNCSASSNWRYSSLALTCDIEGMPPSSSSSSGSKTVSPVGKSERKITRSAMPSATRQPRRTEIFSSADWTRRMLREDSIEMRLRTRIQSMVRPSMASRSVRARCTRRA